MVPVVIQLGLARATADLGRRIQSLDAEVGTWLAKATRADGGLGIYRSRLSALEQMFDELMSNRLRPGYQRLTSAVNRCGYPGEYRKLQQDLRAVQDMWSVFRNGFLLRADPTMRPIIDAANFIAAECFNAALATADTLRPGEETAPPRPAPPLVHLGNWEFPLAVYRELPARYVGARILANQRVPLPVVLVPEDYACCAWLLSFIYHEVGHLIDRELAISGAVGRTIKHLGLGDDQGQSWMPWLEEMVADLFGVLLGGPGYGFCLADLLRAVGPALPADGRYPPIWLRVRLVADLIARHGGEVWKAEADKIRALAHPAPSSDPLLALLPGLEQVAAACLAASVDALGGASVRQLAPLNPEAWRKTEVLAAFLANGKDRPEPTDFPCRLVPSAAQLAVVRAEIPNLDEIHERAIEFAVETDRPTFLDGATSKAEFYRELANKMTLDPNMD